MSSAHLCVVAARYTIVLLAEGAQPLLVRAVELGERTLELRDTCLEEGRALHLQGVRWPRRSSWNGHGKAVEEVWKVRWKAAGRSWSGVAGAMEGRWRGGGRAVEGHGGAMEGRGRPWTVRWNAVEGRGRSWKVRGTSSGEGPAAAMSSATLEPPRLAAPPPPRFGPPAGEPSARCCSSCCRPATCMYALRTTRAQTLWRGESRPPACVLKRLLRVMLKAVKGCGAATCFSRTQTRSASDMRAPPMAEVPTLPPPAAALTPPPCSCSASKAARACE